MFIASNDAVFNLCTYVAIVITQFSTLSIIFGRRKLMQRDRKTFAITSVVMYVLASVVIIHVGSTYQAPFSFHFYI